MQRVKIAYRATLSALENSFNSATNYSICTKSLNLIRFIGGCLHDLSQSLVGQSRLVKSTSSTVGEGDMSAMTNVPVGVDCFALASLLFQVRRRHDQHIFLSLQALSFMAPAPQA